MIYTIYTYKRGTELSIQFQESRDTRSIDSNKERMNTFLNVEREKNPCMNRLDERVELHAWKINLKEKVKKLAGEDRPKFGYLLRDIKCGHSIKSDTVTREMHCE